MHHAWNQALLRRQISVEAILAAALFLIPPHNCMERNAGKLQFITEQQSPYCLSEIKQFCLLYFKIQCTLEKKNVILWLLATENLLAHELQHAQAAHGHQMIRWCAEREGERQKEERQIKLQTGHVWSSELHLLDKEEISFPLAT